MKKTHKEEVGKQTAECTKRTCSRDQGEKDTANVNKREQGEEIK